MFFRNRRHVFRNKRHVFGIDVISFGTDDIFFLFFLPYFALKNRSLKFKWKSFVNSIVYFIFALGGYFLFVLAVGLGFYYYRTVLLKNRRQSITVNEQYCLAAHNAQQQSVPEKETECDPSSINGNLQQRLLVYKLNDYILDNKTVTANVLDRDKLASALSTNRTTLSKSVRDVTGKTLMEYINLLRLEKTVSSLDNPSGLTLEAIAEAYGFTYCKFYRHFIEHYHCTPSEYRKKAFHPSMTANA